MINNKEKIAVLCNEQLLRAMFNLGRCLSEESPRWREREDLSMFKDVVKVCLDYEQKPAKKAEKLKQSRNSNEVNVEKYSGLRIRLLLDQL